MLKQKLGIQACQSLLENLLSYEGILCTVDKLECYFNSLHCVKICLNASFMEINFSF